MNRPRIAFALSALTMALVTAVAAADDPFEIATSKGEITVVTKGHWHVNKDYSWKVTVGDKTLDKTQFLLTETSAKVSHVPQGTAKVKGAVCNGDQCLPFGKEVVVP